ncbi:MAG: hypothetical protein JRE64_05325 [Deltaproteobacteria bacterium]|jgi:hypothetical protein|nr:hypothetical protein [Deltaproteobacteria bacterium]
MDRVVYILGTSHAYQRNDDGCEPSSIEEFRKYLEAVCQLYRVKAIGEEMSISALEENDRKQSIPAKFAQALDNLQHKYCDPDRAEQERLGIKPSEYFRVQAHLEKWSIEKTESLEWNEDLKREPYWLCQIQDLNLWPLLFICGPKHVESFRKLLTVATFTVHIVDHTWEPRADNN